MMWVVLISGIIGLASVRRVLTGAKQIHSRKKDVNLYVKVGSSKTAMDDFNSMNPTHVKEMDGFRFGSNFALVRINLVAVLTCTHNQRFQQKQNQNKYLTLSSIFYMSRILFFHLCHYLNVMRQSACLVFNPIMVDNCAAFFNCMPVVRASPSFMDPT